MTALTLDAPGPAPLSACPACAALPAATALAETPPRPDALLLSLPTLHCAACIAKVEAALLAHPGVRAARVNLTLKRVSVEAAPGVTAADLLPCLAAVGYPAQELDGAALTDAGAQAARALLMRLAVAGFAMMNVMLLSVAVWSGAEGPTRDLFHWISAAITLPAVAFSAQPFFANALTALRARHLTMDVPISLAILLALVTSLWEVTLSGEHAYFDAAIALTFFLLTGRYLDLRSRAAARSAAAELAALEVPRALRVGPGGEALVPVADLRVGDLIRLTPGGRAPVDGVIHEGASELDRSALTGETLPVAAGPGDAVSAGEVSLSGALTLRATAVGRDTALARMADLVAVAEAGRARYTALADRAAKLYAPGVHILAGLAFLGWLAWAGDLRVALNIAAAVLIITCPCALGLAVPAVTTAASGRLFRRGLLLKSATALERLAEVDTVVFDKTGTLTTGRPLLANAGEIDPQSFRLAMGLARGSAHPLSRAILEAGQAAGLSPVALEDLREVPGHGSEARWQGQRLRLGRADWVGGAGGAQSGARIGARHGAQTAAPADAQTSAQTGAPADGSPAAQTCAWLAVGDAPPCVFRFSDGLRPGAAEAVAALQAEGLRVLLLSGDTPAAVADLAQRLAIRDWQAGALPQDKLDRVEALRRDGARVLMLGDGLNDTAALAAAHVSISPASALDAARAASDIVLLGQSLAPLPGALTTARQAVRRIRENFTIATAYNVIAVPLAVAGLCSPLIAALAMSTSSITVSLNALRLR